MPNYFLEEMGALVNSDKSLQKKKTNKTRSLKDDQHHMSFYHSIIVLIKVPITGGRPKEEEFQLNKYWT